MNASANIIPDVSHVARRRRENFVSISSSSFLYDPSPDLPVLPSLITLSCKNFRRRGGRKEEGREREDKNVFLSSSVRYRKILDKQFGLTWMGKLVVILLGIDGREKLFK